MKFYLATLAEKQEQWEGDKLVGRVSSLLSNSKRHFEVSSPEQADILLFLESNRFKSNNSISVFRNTNHLIKWAHKAYTLNYSYAPIDFLPGLYVSLPLYMHDFRWTRAIPYPWPSPNPIIAKLDSCAIAIKYKLTFRGSISHPVRQKMLDAILRTPGLGPCRSINKWFNHTQREHYDYLQEIAESMFVACPRGIGTSSYRLYETLKLGRVPVIISDEWAPPKDIDWNACSIQIAEDRVHNISTLIEQTIARWSQMSDHASYTWEKYMSDDTLGNYLFDQLESLFWAREENTDWGYMERRFRSPSFARRHKWDILSKFDRVSSRLWKDFITL